MRLTSILLLFWCTFSFTQTNSDSLLLLVKNHPEKDTLRVNYLIDYAATTYHDDSEDGLDYILEAISLSKSINYDTGLGFSNTALSGYFYQKGQLDSTLIYAFKAVEIFERIGDKRHILSAQNNIAMVYNNQGKTDKAIEIYLKIYDLLEKREYSINHLAISNNLALAYMTLNDFDSAEKWFFNVENISEKIGQNYGKAYAYSGLAEVYNNTNRSEKALEYSIKGLEIGKEIGADKLVIEAYQNIGLAYQKKKDFSKAIFNYKEALKLADTIKAIRNIEATSKKLFECYNSIKDYKNALKYLELNHTMKDSLYSIEKIETLESVEAKYEKTKAIKEKEIAELEKTKSDLSASKAKQEKELAEAEKAESQQFFITVITITIAVIALLVLVFVGYRNKKQKEKIAFELKSTQEKLEVEKDYRMAELKAIKSQMNPHFMFNALNSIQEYIMLNNKDLATDYLGKFAALMRIYLNHSQEGTIDLEEEINALELYLELESVRFDDSIEYKIHKDDTVSLDIELPSMLIQPYVENAIKHGLLHKENNRKLDVYFKLNKDILEVKVIDNGIGRKASEHINKKRSPMHKSFATSANQTRLELLNHERSENIGVEIKDAQSGEGTEVTIKVPI